MVLDGGLEDRLLPAAARRVLREEAHRHRVVAERRQREAAHAAIGGRVELVRNLQQDAGAVAGARIAAGGAAMREVDEDLERLLDDVVRSGAIERGDEAEPARVVLEAGVV